MSLSRRLVIAPVLAILALVLATPLAPPVRAHADLVSTAPVDGSELAAAPSEVVFTFTEPLLPDFVRFIRISETGESVDLTATSIESNIARLAWPADLPAGVWTVEYRVVSQDGHPVSGSIFFSYGASTPTPSPTPTPTPTPTGSPTQTGTPDPVPTTAPAPSPTISPTNDETGSTTGWLIAGIAVIALAIIVIIGLIVRRR